MNEKGDERDVCDSIQSSVNEVRYGGRRRCRSAASMLFGSVRRVRFGRKNAKNPN